MSFTKNFDYTGEHGTAEVNVRKGEPHYREQADLILEERPNANPKFRTYRILFASTKAIAAGFKAHNAGGTGIKWVGDTNRLAEDNPDLVIKRIDLRGEARIMGSTNWRKTDWDGSPRGTHAY